MSINQTFIDQDNIDVLIKQHDRIAFDYLYDNYAATLFGVIRRLIGCPATSADLLQDCFEKIWCNIERYDSRKGALYTWMHSIARNLAIDYLRSKENKVSHRTIHFDMPAPITNTQCELNVNTIGIEKFVSRLPEKYNEVITMFYYQGMTVDQTSRCLNVPSGTVKTRLRKALALLRISVS